ncbi:MAG: hypothetical protein P0121_00930 [Nitrospira sp.]|nr:hypothetical protein [Nitrospira sp.]
MPLSRIQSDILRLIAAHRDPESYIAGSTPLNVDAPRYSGDIDVFHDREDRVARAAQTDAAVLEQHGYALEWIRREPTMYAVLAAREQATTRLEWVVDSEFGFFRRCAMTRSGTSCTRSTSPPIKSPPLMAVGSRVTWWIC